MIFLIEYDRPKGSIVSLKSFSNSERLKAESARLKLELDLNRKEVDHEVVLLEAASKAALLRTHRRYFENASQILKSAAGGAK
jgi:hypothetical protein